MANLKYFADGGAETVELTSIRHDGSIYSTPKHFTGLTPTGERITVTRIVEYKAHPSKHECDDRCVHATGRTMRCECSCGGKNHGKGR